jgi:hypothetical protein
VRGPIVKFLAASTGTADLFSHQSSLLERNLSLSNPGLTESQKTVDGLVEGFVRQAIDLKTLAPMVVGGLAYRLGRVGAMSTGLGHAFSIGAGLATEVTTFEVTNRFLQNPPTPPFAKGGQGGIWRWSGPGGLKEGLLQSFITFSTLKFGGWFTQGQNLILQHGVQDLAMVAGHQFVYHAGMGSKPEGTFADQMLHAETTNLQFTAGMALGHQLAPGIRGIETGLDLSLRTTDGGANLVFAQIGRRSQGSPLQMQPAFAAAMESISSPSFPRENDFPASSKKASFRERLGFLFGPQTVKMAAKSVVGKTYDWKKVLSQLWEKGKTESTIARKGVSVDIEGQTYQVKHNRRGKNAILRIQSSDDPTKLIFVFLEDVYQKVPKRHGNLLSEINEKVEMKEEISGRMDSKGDFVVDLSGGESAAQIHGLLEVIARATDLNTGIKNFRLRWQGDLMQMLPYSLQHPLYDMVRVSQEGDLIVHNFRELGNEQVHAEQHERQIGTGIQKAINLKEGIVSSQDPEDIEIRITAPKIIDYIQSLIHQSGQDPQHPQFQELYNFYVNILLQVKSTRDSLDHLIPVQHNELLRVIIGGEGKESTAYYKSRATERGKKHYLDQQESHYQAHLVFPPTRYNFSEGLSILEIALFALKAEIRHHIHYMNMDLLGNKLPPGLFGAGMTEIVDDMQSFANAYYQTRRTRKDSMLKSIFGSHEESNIEISKNKAIELQLKWNHFWWTIGTILDNRDFPGLNGHIFTKHIHDILIEKFCDRPSLSPEEINRIDKSVFDYLSNTPVSNRVSIWLMIDNIKGLKRLISINAPELMIANRMNLLSEAMGLDEAAKLDIANLYRWVDLYESFQSQLSEYLMFAKNGPKNKDKEGSLLRQLIEQVKELRGTMLQLYPFHAPDGKDYISPSAYYLNPKVIYAEIIKRHPELGGGGSF